MDPSQGFTRREFVQTGVGLVGLGLTVPAFLSQTVEALAGPNGGKPGDERILVVLQLAGGNDGLNTVIPFENDLYYRARPRIAVPADRVLKLEKDQGLHPDAVGLKRLWDEGHLAVLHGIGYPNPNRSHFTATRIWETASPDGRMRDGWLGRYFDNTCKGSDPCDPQDGFALVDETPLAMQGDRFQPLCVPDPRNWRMRQADTLEDLLDDEPMPEPKGKKRPRSRHAKKSGAEKNLDFLRRTMLDTAVSAREIRAAARKEIEGAEFPGSRLGRSLESVARMIHAGVPTRVYYVSHTGFDTHANQNNRHARLMRELGDALSSFMMAMKSTGLADRVLVMGFSEFGRRVEENASGGTDHGEAAPMFLAGSKVKPGLHGAMPRLDKLHRGDLAFHTDFRQVYATVLKNWLKTDPGRILRGNFRMLPVLKKR